MFYCAIFENSSFPFSTFFLGLRKINYSMCSRRTLIRTRQCQNDKNFSRAISFNKCVATIMVNAKIDKKTKQIFLSSSIDRILGMVVSAP